MRYSNLFGFTLMAAAGGLIAAMSPSSRADLGRCTGAPEYYAIDLVPTRNLPGLARAGGTGWITYQESPFGISVTPAGHYSYDLAVEAEHLPLRDDGEYIVWVTSPNLDQIKRVGPLDSELTANTRVTLNKFLVVVTFEPLGTSGETWLGPVILRGMSRSGLMHTMAGHGPFSTEPCAKYGY